MEIEEQLELLLKIPGRRSYILVLSKNTILFNKYTVVETTEGAFTICGSDSFWDAKDLIYLISETYNVEIKKIIPITEELEELLT